MSADPLLLSMDGDIEGRGRRETRRARTGSAARTDLQVNCLCCNELMEDEVQDNQYDKWDAEQPAEKIRHDVSP